MRKTVRWYVWKEHLFSAAGTPDVELKILGRTLAEHTAEKFDAQIVDAFPRYPSTRNDEIVVVLRSSHTCLPKSGVEALISRAEAEKKNAFFGAGWILVDGENVSLAKYRPLKAGAAFLSLADYPFVAECLRMEILKRLLRRGVVIENTSGVYVDATSFIESGAVLSHDVTVSGKSLIKGGARIRPYTLIEDSTVSSFAEVGPFVHLRPDTCVGSYCRIDSFTELKNTALGDGTQAASLSYIGDADVGEKCNIGCGTLFVDCDGNKKSRSKIGKGCSVGGSVIVAPVAIRDDSCVAAGSLLSQKVSGGESCIAREKEAVLGNGADK
ncbi:MAG: hypothetical protein HPZ86_08995 [Clostridia bacterium]|nr:hypothetical protein [Clostridia bacterium]